MEENQNSAIFKKIQTFGDTYCGADRGLFKWCQTISDADVEITISPTIKSFSDVKVEATHNSILVQIKPAKNLWYTIIEDKFSGKIKPKEVIWTFEPGKISIHLEKAHEMWWDSLLAKEPKINLQEIELSRPLTDLTQEEEMTLQRLWNEQLGKICQIEKDCEE